MNPSTSESRGDRLEADRPGAPASIRYPQSAVRYPLMSLAESGPRPSRTQLRKPYTVARLRRMKLKGRSLLWWVPLWYVLGQICLLLWMDESWQMPRTRVQHEKWVQIHERLAEMPDRPLVLMLGSSRSDWAFQTGRLSNQLAPDGRPILAYNFGLPTAGPMHASYYLNELLDEGVRPRLVLVEFVATHLNRSRRGLQSEEHFTLPRWCSLHQLLFLRRYFTNPRRALGEWFEAQIAPWYGYRFFVHEHIVGRKEFLPNLDQVRQPMDDWGARILCDDPGTPEYRTQRWAYAFQMYKQSLEQFQLGKGPALSMHDLLARCQREKIPVAIVNLPVTKEFQDLYPAEAKADLDKLLADLLKRYDAHLIDASDWLRKEEFDDGHHVLRAGAKKFTTRMIDEVHKLLAQTEPAAARRETP